MNEFEQFISGKDAQFRYSLLSRMQADCKYYLGNGRLFGPHLWAGNEKDQITCMKLLWESFPADAKPEWLTWDDILAYEKRLDPHYKLQQDALNRIAGSLNVVAWYPAYHAEPTEKNPVLLYLLETYEHNQKLSREASSDYFMHFYYKPNEDPFLKPFYTFENSDTSGSMTYDFACGGQVDLRSENWETQLLAHIQQALAAYQQKRGLAD